MIRRAAGLALAAALLAGCWYGWANYGAFADIARWTGAEALRPVRPWLVEFRLPLVAAALFLALSAVSWAWQRLKLGH